MRLRALAVAGAIGIVAPLGLVTPAHAADVALPNDFDGDGHPELVVGAFDLQVGSVPRAGGVVVLPASAKGLSLKEQVITQASPGVPGGPERNDQFGYASASADFDADGYADLAISSPSERVGDQPVGTVTVIHGGPGGLDTRTATLLALPDSYYLGAQMVTGDFTGDGYPDLAVAADSEDYQGFTLGGAAGVVRIIPGGRDGLSTTGVVELRGRRSADAVDAYFGFRLAAGDLDGDGVSDLVVGAQDSYVADRFGRSGSISACLGAKGGPRGCSVVAENPYLASQTGLAIGNVTGSATPEIVVSSYLWNVDDIGHVEVLRLKDSDPTELAGQTDITASSAGAPGSQHEEFGASLALGDVDHDGFADLVVGAAGADDSRGRVVVVHGSRDGYRTSGNEVFGQATPGVPGKAQRREFFGEAVSLQDHDHDGNLDLAVGTPGENHYAGAVTTLRGTPAGLTTTGAKTFGLKTLSYRHPDKAYFGYALGR